MEKGKSTPPGREKKRLYRRERRRHGKDPIARADVGSSTKEALPAKQPRSHNVSTKKERKIKERRHARLRQKSVYRAPEPLKERETATKGITGIEATIGNYFKIKIK